MAVTTHPLPRCGINITAGDGSIYLEAAVADVKNETYAIHVERFSVADGRTTLDPSAASVFLGSDIAHTQFEFADGWLWLFFDNEVLQISPTTGLVVRRFTSTINQGGAEPLIVGDDGDVWFAGGAGSGAQFLRIDVSSGATRTVTMPGEYASVYGLATDAGRLLFLYLADGANSNAPITTTLTNHIGEFSPSGRLIATSRNEAVPSNIVGVSGGLYGVGPDGTCTSTSLSVTVIDPVSLDDRVIASLTTPGTTCLGDGGYRPVATAGADIFVLYATQTAATLYRVTPHSD